MSIASASALPLAAIASASALPFAELAATVEREADARKYAAEREAEAKLIQEQKDAEAILYKQQKEAEAIEARGKAEAAAISAKGKAEADAIAAKGKAEAEAMDKKAEAYKKYNGAAMVEMFIKIMPQMAHEIAAPLASIDKVNIYGGGDGNGVSSISNNLPIVMKQVMDTMSEATGVDMAEIIKASTYDAKVTKNINLDGIPEPKISQVSNTNRNPKLVEEAPVEE